MRCEHNISRHRLLVIFCHWKTFRCFFCVFSSSNAHFFYCGFDCVGVIVVVILRLFFHIIWIVNSIFFFSYLSGSVFFLHRSHPTTWCVYIYEHCLHFFFSEQRILCSFFSIRVVRVSSAWTWSLFFLLFLLVYGLFRFFTQFFLLFWTFVRVARIYYLLHTSKQRFSFFKCWEFDWICVCIAEDCVCFYFKHRKWDVRLFNIRFRNFGHDSDDDFPEQVQYTILCNKLFFVNSNRFENTLPIQMIDKIGSYQPRLCLWFWFIMAYSSD